MKIAIQHADFDVATELAELRAKHRDVGAVVSFVGVVREMSGDAKLECMELEHYPNMTEKSLVNIVQQAIGRWDIKDVVVIHRIGRLPVNAQIVMVAVASRHRGMAFDACEFVMDYLKTTVPFWKKEFRSDGVHWVGARSADADALKKWEENR